MRNTLLAASFTLLLAFPAPALAPDNKLGAQTTACCFTNPAYSGVCRVTPAAEETCASILAYLNDSRSSGKSYCNATDVRGGWKQTGCDPAPKIAAP